MSQTQRENEYFIPGDGVSCDVIQAKLQRYLGDDALVKPGNRDVRIPSNFASPELCSLSDYRAVKGYLFILIKI
jgi:hypothetical protein